MTRQFFDWNRSNTMALTSLYAKGLSFTLIAEKIGQGLTGMAARKKASRLGLKGHVTTTWKTMGPNQRPKPVPKPKPIEPEAIGPIEDIADGCKYIAGDPKQPGWRMCGHPGTPWCEYHAPRMTVPARSAP